MYIEAAANCGVRPSSANRCFGSPRTDRRYRDVCLPANYISASLSVQGLPEPDYLKALARFPSQHSP